MTHLEALYLLTEVFILKISTLHKQETSMQKMMAALFLGAMTLAVSTLMSCDSPAGSTTPAPTPPPALYTVTYHGNGETAGTAPQDRNTYASGSIVRVKNNSLGLVRDGHSFEGWNSQEDASDPVTYQGGDTFVMHTGHFNLYAVWQPLTGGIEIVDLSLEVTGPALVTYGTTATYTVSISGGTADEVFWYLEGVPAGTGMTYTTPDNLSYGPHTVTVFARHADNLFSASRNFVVE